jgi:hypothetical protein
MPYVLLILGAILFVAGVRGKNADLWALVQGDFTGQNSFVFWVAAVAIVGGLGYIKPLKSLSVAFMTLLLIVLFLSNKGVIAQLQTYLQSSGVSVTPTVPVSDVQTLAPLAPLEEIGSNLKGFGSGMRP